GAPRLQARQREQPAYAALVEEAGVAQDLVAHGHRQPEVGLVRDPPEPGWRHAHDLIALAVHHHLFADHLRIAAEAALPEGMAQDEDPRLAGFGIVLADESATDDRLDTEQAEVGGVDDLAGGPLRLPRGGQVEGEGGAVGADLLEGLAPHLPVPVIE